MRFGSLPLLADGADDVGVLNERESTILPNKSRSLVKMALIGLMTSDIELFYSIIGDNIK